MSASASGAIAASGLAPCVLIVDDEFLIAQGFVIQVEDMGLRVCSTAASCEDAIVEAETHRPSIVLMDMRLQGDRDGVDAALAIGEAVGSKIIFVTGSREPVTMERIALAKPSAVLFKPVSDLQLSTAIEDALR